MNLPGAIVFILMGFVGLMEMTTAKNPTDGNLAFIACVVAGTWLGLSFTYIGAMLNADEHEGPPEPPFGGDPA